jgi:hypothetical protein
VTEHTVVVTASCLACIERVQARHADTAETAADLARVLAVLRPRLTEQMERVAKIVRDMKGAAPGEIRQAVEERMGIRKSRFYVILKRLNAVTVDNC